MVLGRCLIAKVKEGRIEPLEPVDLTEGEELVVMVEAPDDADVDAFRRSAGGWKELVPEEFIAEIHRRRETRRKPVNL